MIEEDLGEGYGFGFASLTAFSGGGRNLMTRRPSAAFIPVDFILLDLAAQRVRPGILKAADVRGCSSFLSLEWRFSKDL